MHKDKTDQPSVEKWAIVARYFTGDQDRWLDDFIHDDGLSFGKIVPRKAAENWHLQAGRTTSLQQWVDCFWQVRDAYATKPDGMVACFPQLAMVAGALKRLRRADHRIIAYTFNLGALPPGMRQRLARFAAPAIEAFVVHSPSEVTSYAAYLGVPETAVHFVPLQRGDTDIQRNENTAAPFILSMGSAHRDYPTLIEAVDALQIPTVIVTRPDDIDSFPKSNWVTYKTHLSQRECHALLAQARLSVTPVSNMTTASGQITFIDALRLGVPTIATRCPGSDGYITHAETGLLVNPFDRDDMKAQISLLWNDAAARDRLSEAAVKDARARFTDQASANRLHALIRAR